MSFITVTACCGCNILPTLWMGKLRHAEAKYLGPSRRDSKRMRLDLDQQPDSGGQVWDPEPFSPQPRPLSGFLSTSLGYLESSGKDSLKLKKGRGLTLCKMSRMPHASQRTHCFQSVNNWILVTTFYVRTRIWVLQLGKQTLRSAMIYPGVRSGTVCQNWNRARPYGLCLPCLLTAFCLWKTL